jgi:hypothetical protein
MGTMPNEPEYPPDERAGVAHEARTTADSTDESNVGQAVGHEGPEAPATMPNEPEYPPEDEADDM